MLPLSVDQVELVTYQYTHHLLFSTSVSSPADLPASLSTLASYPLQLSGTLITCVEALFRQVLQSWLGA